MTSSLQDRITDEGSIELLKLFSQITSQNDLTLDDFCGIDFDRKSSSQKLQKCIACPLINACDKLKNPRF